MSAPGAGKTSLLEKTIQHFRQKIPMAVIEGDICGDYDLRRLSTFNIPLVQINTDKWGGECHLDASMIKNAIKNLDLSKIRLLFIENVGNLVCPAEFNLGEDKKVMLLSVSEGDDKPLKYPLMFRMVDLLLLNKIDLLPFTDFNLQEVRNTVSKINPKITIIEISVKTEEGLEKWYEWVLQSLQVSQ
jgi:hydrogenase nickel incorporation protein HypB